MKIIKPGTKPKEVAYRGECQCECVFEITEAELRWFRWNAQWMLSENESGCYCPNCGARIKKTDLLRI